MKRKWIAAITIVVVLAIISSYIVYVQGEQSRRGLATRSASEMLIDGPVLSGNWERRPYGGFGGYGHPTDTAGYSYLRNSSGTYDAILWIGLWGYGSVDEARQRYGEITRAHGGNFSGHLDIGENATSWYFDRFSQPIYDTQVYWDHAYSIIVLKMNYWIDVTVAFNDDSGINYDNVVQLAREQAASIY